VEKIMSVENDKEILNFLYDCYDKNIDETRLQIVKRNLKKKGRKIKSLFTSDAGKIIGTTIIVGLIAGSGLSLINNHFTEYQSLKKSNKGLITTINDIEDLWKENRTTIKNLEEELIVYKQIVELSPIDRATFDTCNQVTSQTQTAILQQQKLCLALLDE
jgi:hypothetical protein